MKVDSAALADALLACVLAAGRVEMAYYADSIAVEKKADSSPVTAADREAEAILLEGLSRAAPGVPVIAEESVSAGSVPDVGAWFFLVDPLDGTREFVKKRDEFTINIGLVGEGRPVFGIVYAPALGDLYATTGERHAVWTHLKPDAAVQSLTGCRLEALATREPDPAALVALESRSHRSPATDEFLKRYAVRETRASGSSLKFCLIARGEADFYPRIGATSEWDTAAGQAVLEAAGGSVTTLDFAPLTYGKREEGFINPHFVAWARKPLPPRP